MYKNVLSVLLELPYLSVNILCLSLDIHLYKRWVATNFTLGHDCSGLPGKDAKICTDPIIIRRHRGTDSTEREKDYENITLDRLFNPDKGQSSPNVVVLQGHSGYGKSITTQKIICDWASGGHYAEMFDLVVLLRCKELNMELGEGEQGGFRSLLELISTNQRFRPAIERILTDASHKVLFIIDGFDALKKSADPSSRLPSQPLTRAPPTDTVLALLRGRILPESFLLVTTRPTASKALRNLLKEREQSFTDIFGFSESTVRTQYLPKFLGDSQEHQSLCDDSNILFYICSVPMTCWMICSVLKRNPQAQWELATRTSIFVQFVSISLGKYGMGKSEVLKMLVKLARMEHLPETDRLSDLDKIAFLQRSSVRQHVTYSFMHQSIQEFFSALHVVNLGEAEVEREVTNLLCSVDECLLSQSLPVIGFLFGLSNASVWCFLNKFGLCSHQSSDNTIYLIQDLLKKWILREVDKFILKDLRLFFLHCLYELHEDDFVKKVMTSWRKVDIPPFPLKLEDCWALRYCLQHNPDIVRLNLSNCNLTAEKLKLLKPALSDLRCEELW